MNKIFGAIALAAATLVASQTAFAETKVLAELGYIAVPKLDRSTINRVAEIKVMSDSTASITVSTFNGYFPAPEEIRVTTFDVEIPYSVYSTIYRSIAQLSKAETKTEELRAVCEIAVGFGSGQILQVSRSFDGPDGLEFGLLETVMRDNGCWDPVTVRPVHSYNVELANRLIGQLEILTLSEMAQ